MSCLYIIISATPTFMGKVIRTLTHSTYNHCSISLTEDWSEMYSFARYRASNPLVGGFVKEFRQRLSLGKDRNVSIEVYKIPVSEKQYNQVKAFIYSIRDDEEENIYNTMAAIGLLFGWKFKAHKAYTCSSFVYECLVAGDVISKNHKHRNILPETIRKLIGEHLYYSGYLSNYISNVGATNHNSDFYKKESIIKEFMSILKHFNNLIKRRSITHDL